ncbi:hypothetical protein C8F04DRAFT_1035751 [Mycena alexandri]|uniref:F-box domain-containing protein n=1 Tax=Mycena alexandri TaxID=1745969 RepID=A0AAD6X770_9AGAR|nr:hypothetical protein C8F04DRAFT_1035751 [Mycena alexandri]
MISPFASKLGTNYCPSDEEVLEIQRLLVEPLSRLKGIDDKIAELQKTIVKLTQERDSVSTYVEAHKALISPLLRLPLDIIQEIFIACLPAHRNCVMSAVEAPVLLGRICSLWRTVSLSTPRLWARLHIAEPGGPRQEKYAQRIAITKAWLERSAHCPLSISLEGTDLPFGLPDPINPFLEVILSSVSRWQHIALTISSWAWSLDTLFSLTEHDVPTLETLEIFQTQLSRPSSQQPSFGLFRGPKISSIALTTLDTRLFALPLQWENLTSLCLINLNLPGESHDLLTSDAALKVLSKCIRLRTCHLRLVEATSPSALEESFVELPHLHSLDITCIGLGLAFFCPGHMFSRLLLPELRSLTVSGGWNTNAPSGPFFSFLTVSPKLERLQLEPNLFNKQLLLDLLSVLPPTIQRLISLSPGADVSAPVDTFLLAPITTLLKTACPILQELEIGSCLDLSDHALLHFIKARMAVQPPTLRRVAIQFQREKQFDIRPEIQAFLDSGLEVLTRYYVSSVRLFSPWRGLADAPQSHTSVS